MRGWYSRALAGACLALLVVGCGSDKSKGKLACPAAFIAPNLDSYTVYRPGVTPSTTNVQDITFGVKLARVASLCKVEPGGIRVVTSLTFAAIRNAPDVLQGDFTYFVAIADARQQILAKQDFALRVNFAKRQNQMRVMDEITEHLPLNDISKGSQYAVIVGMQVSKEQLDLNRQR